MIRFGWLQHFIKPASAKWWIVAWTLLLLAAGITIWVLFPCWLSGSESASATLRNLGLVIAAAVALPLGIWRSIIAERQADAAQRQSELALQNMLNERFHKGAEMLGHPEIRSVRLGGIYALGRLAREYREVFHLQVIQLFSAFVVDQTTTGEAPEKCDALVDSGAGRNENTDQSASLKTKEESRDIAENPAQQSSYDFYLAVNGTIPRPPRLAKDVEEVMRLIAERSEEQIALEIEYDFRLNLADVSLGGLTLQHVNFSNIDFTKANLCRIRLWSAQFSNVSMPGVDLSAAYLPGVDLRKADMRRVNLSGANLTGADLRNAELGPVDLASQNLWGTKLFTSKLVGVLLEGADLRGANMVGADLTGAQLAAAKLIQVKLTNANLSRADLRAANLSAAELSGANLSGANLERANLSGADFSKGSSIRSETALTQDQLDQAQADPVRPPHLEGTRDSVSGKPLSWRGQPLDPDWYNFR